MLDLRGMIMLSFVKIVDTMSRQVWERESTNTESPFAKFG
jgi:hypothetical protein